MKKKQLLTRYYTLYNTGRDVFTTVYQTAKMFNKNGSPQGKETQNIQRVNINVNERFT